MPTNLFLHVTYQSIQTRKTTEKVMKSETVILAASIRLFISYLDNAYIDEYDSCKMAVK